MRASLLLLACCTLTTAVVAQANNPVYRANRSFYTSMWTTNPPEYTASGQTVPAGTMHWRAFTEQSNQRAEPRLVTSIGTWWQPSDLAGTFPQTIPTLEFRFYPTTTDTAGLVVPDLAQQPLLTLPPLPMPVQSGNAFNSVTISFGGPTPLLVQGDFAICGLYPANASSSAPGFFGLLPSASNQTQGLQQSYYGFTYASGTITHFNLGGARSSIWYTEQQPTLSLRTNWAISADHFNRGFIGGAWGDANYFSPLADPTWAGWSDGRSPAILELTVFADGQDGLVPLLLFNWGARFPTGFQFLGLTLEVLPSDPLLTAFSVVGQPITSGRWDLSLVTLSAADPALMGSYFGFEAVLLDTQNLLLVDSTQSVWVAH